MSVEPQPSFLPRPGDLERTRLVQLANQMIAQHGGPTKCTVRFKFTCCWCGTRCTITEPNTLYESGECCECGKTTDIVAGGIQLEMKVGP